MELLYVWIHEYKNIHQQGFNFSAEYDIEFEPTTKEGELTGTLSITKSKKDHIEKFWDDTGKITNVMAVVGENGAGKSSLLWVLMNHFKKGLPKVFDDGVLMVYKKDSTSFFYSYSKEVSNGNNKLPFKPRPHPNSSITPWPIDRIKVDNLFLSYEPFFAPFKFQDAIIKTNSGRFQREDLSTTASLIRDAGLDGVNDMGGVGLHFSVWGYTAKEKVREVLMVSILAQNDKFLSITLPSEIVITLGNSPPNKDRESNGRSKIMQMVRACNSFSQKTEGFDDWILKYWIKVFYNFIRWWDYFLENKYGEDNENREQDWLHVTLKQSLNKFVKLHAQGKVTIEDTISFFKNLQGDISQHKKPLASQIINQIDAIQTFIDNNIKGYWNNKSLPKTSHSIPTMRVKVTDKSFQEIINNYQKTFSIAGYLTFEWWQDGKEYYFSSGEQAFLSLFSRFWGYFNSYSFQEKVATLSQVTILIDEGELTLHPQWQKQFVYNLVELVKHLPNLESKKVQIILTTHSPLLLSDFPAENVIFLRKFTKEDVKKAPKQKVGNCMVVNREDKQTFGANVHSLLADSFFLQGGLVGEFAKQKLQDVWDYINFDENAEEPTPKEEKAQRKKEEARYNELVSKGWNQDKAWRIIKKIGEPFVKSSFENKYFEKFPDDELKRLKARVKMLQDKFDKQNDTNKTK